MAYILSPGLTGANIHQLLSHRLRVPECIESKLCDYMLWKQQQKKCLNYIMATGFNTCMANANGQSDLEEFVHFNGLPWKWSLAISSCCYYFMYFM